MKNELKVLEYMMLENYIFLNVAPNKKGGKKERAEK